MGGLAPFGPKLGNNDACIGGASERITNAPDANNSLSPCKVSAQLSAFPLPPMCVFFLNTFKILLNKTVKLHANLLPVMCNNNALPPLSVLQCRAPIRTSIALIHSHHR